MNKDTSNNLPEDKKKREETPLKLHLTEAAVAKIKTMMSKDNKEGCGLRVGVKTGGCAGLSYELRFQQDPYDNDIILEQDDVRIFVNPQSAVFLKGMEIDFKDTLKESGFQYKNPNATSSCGCGLSFS